MALQGKRYRFRMISNGLLDCPIKISIDNHSLLVIASDGNPIQPVKGMIVKCHYGGIYLFLASLFY